MVKRRTTSDGRPIKVFYEGKWRKVFYSNEGAPIVEVRLGKNHRILIDLTNGKVLASNPIPLLAAAAPALLKGAVGLGKKALGAIGLGKKEAAAAPTTPSTTIINKYDNLDKYNQKDRINLALR